ncbi:MAG: efflux RND transporter periplasmic adaptor subunit [Rhodospirillales bacterium]|nr:efflux RND transporter periplasmic adaptor subunit [Rhodospirillales bacterium]
MAEPAGVRRALIAKRVLVVMAFGLGIVACEDDKNVYVPPPPPKVTVAKPVVETITNTLEFTGNTVAYETVKLVARVEGYLEKVHFQDGQRVSKGDLLFTIQQAQYKANVEQAESEVLATKAKLDYAETEYRRFSRLFEQKAAAATQVDQWRFERDSTRAALEAAQAKLANAKLELSYTTVTAPFNGRMGRRLVDPGNLVGAGGEKTVLAEINRIDPIYVYFTINERDLLSVIKPEDRSSPDLAKKRAPPLFMGLATEQGYPHKGTFDFAAISVNPQTGTLQLRGAFPNADGAIVPGLFARIQAPYSQTKDALLVPAEAVGFDQIGRYVLTVGDKNIVERRSVAIGERIGDMQVVTSGLNGGERVIVEGLLRAIPGREVTPEEAPAATPPGAQPKPAT